MDEEMRVSMRLAEALAVARKCEHYRDTPGISRTVREQWQTGFVYWSALAIGFASR